MIRYHIFLPFHTVHGVDEELILLNYVLEKILEIPLDNKKIKLVNPKGNQP